MDPTLRAALEEYGKSEFDKGKKIGMAKAATSQWKEGKPVTSGAYLCKVTMIKSSAVYPKIARYNANEELWHDLEDYEMVVSWAVIRLAR